MNKLKQVISRNIVLVFLILLISLTSIPCVYAAWVASPIGTITYVRTYPIGTGLRLQLGVSGATNNCGTDANTYYFDSDKITLDSVKGILALATTAFLAGRTIQVTYDCTLASGGYGWGTAIQIQ